MEIRLSDVKALVFDWDDTCVATFESKAAQHQEVALNEYGIDLPIEKIKKHWGKPLDKLFSIFYGTDDLETARQHAADYHDRFPKIPMPGVFGLFEDLSADSIPLGLVTATSLSSIQRDAKQTELPGYFDYIQTAEDTSEHKPSPNVFLPTKEWLKSIGIENSSEVAYVGDGLHDMKAAVNAGFQFIGAATGLVSVEEFREAGAKNVVEDMIDLYDELYAL